FVFRRRREGAGRFPFPLFVLGFCVCVGINSLVVLPPSLHQWLIDLSRWSLVTAIAAIGIKTSLKTMASIGYQAVVLITAETIFIAAWILAGITYLT
ncbi:MAG: putative sulfate exporter family transporter, partial [Alphaproteobacteria bacterium]